MNRVIASGTRRLGTLLVALLILGSQVSGAQTSDDGAPDVNDLTNFAFLNYYGTGTYTVLDQRVVVIRVGGGLTLRSLEEYPWGFRLKGAFVFAVQDFDTLDELNLDTYRVYTLVPGVEFLVPVGRLSTLRPWLDFGVGVDDETDQLGLIGGVGLRTEFIQLWRRFRTSLEPGVQYAMSRPVKGPDVRDRFSEVFLKASARHPLWFKMGESQPDVGLYASLSYLFNTLEFMSVTGDTQPIRTLYEIGVILGFQYPRPKVWFVRIPSLNVGFRFGTDFRGIRIGLGGDWSTPIPPGL